MVIFVSHTIAGAQSPAMAPALPIGSPLTIIADETVDPRVRPGSEFRAHLRDPLTVGGTLVATAGTAARLVVTAKETAKDGAPAYRIAIIGLNLGLAGTLPVAPTTPTVGHVTAGMAIPATTLAAVGFEQGKIRVVVPLPFKLSNESPNGGYTPAPLRTAGPVITRRGKPGPSPTPTPSAPAPPSPAAPFTPSPGQPAPPLPTPT
jgi:hypothetical protein